MDMREKLEELAQRRSALMQGGGAKAIARQHARGKLTARERVELFLDPGTFVELDLWAKPRMTGFDIDERELPGDGVITGFGEVNGSPIYVYAQDFTVLGGTMGSTAGKKIVKVMRRALEELVIEGYPTNSALAHLIMHDGEFVRGQYDTSFLDRNLPRLLELARTCDTLTAE